MRQFKLLGTAMAATLLVAACGGGGGGDPFGTQIAKPERGQLMQSPPALVTSLTAAGFKTSLSASASGQGLLQLSTGSTTGDLPCGVDVQYIKYGTVGGAGEQTDASGALMVPTGSDPKCTGARPIVLYAHGTDVSKRYNLAEIADSTNPANKESVLLAAMYAAQGFIVVAPNYAGYDSSSLSYHPYVNADQQSKDMIDALAAAKSALPSGKASSKLFVTGYSQGGFVAMATVRAMQALPTPIPVTASAPMSGPYALEAYMDAIFSGQVALGATVFAPMLATSMQKAYPNSKLYNTPSDFYESTYATGIESLIPGPYESTTALFTALKLPSTALFYSAQTTPPFGFGPSNLIKDAVHADYLADAAVNTDGRFTDPQTFLPSATPPQNNLRLAARANDLRTAWMPHSPTLLCGGNADPTVFFSINTLTMASIWAPYVSTPTVPNLITVLDVDSAAQTGDPFALVKGGFAQAKAGAPDAAYNAAIAAGKTTAEADYAKATAVTTAYHGSLVPPFCNAAARGFFNQVLAATALN